MREIFIEIVKECYVVRTGPIALTCAQCGATFGVYPSRIKSGNVKFCSNACQGAAMRRAPTRVCEQCGQPFHIKPSVVEKGHGRFCSRPCWHVAMQHDPEAFWAKVDQSATAPDACWPWTGALSSSGYGKAWWQGREWQAHRLAWVLTNGDMPAELIARHTCEERYAPGDVSYRKCCRPDHCRPGTARDNAQDRVRSGRGMHGERHYRAKVTPATVEAIRAGRRAGATWLALGQQYGLSKSQIGRIVNGTSWRPVG